MRHDNTTRWMRWLAAMAALVLLAAACSSGDDDDGGGDAFGLGGDEADSDADDSGSGSGDSGGDDSGGSDGGDSGGGLGASETEGGIPFPAGGRDLLAEAGIEIGGQRQLAYPRDAYDEIVAFYEDWVESHPGQVVSSEIDDQRLWQLLPEEGGGMVGAITVVKDSEESVGGDLVTFVLLVDGSGG